MPVASHGTANSAARAQHPIVTSAVRRPPHDRSWPARSPAGRAAIASAHPRVHLALVTEEILGDTSRVVDLAKNTGIEHFDIVGKRLAQRWIARDKQDGPSRDARRLQYGPTAHGAGSRCSRSTARPCRASTSEFAPPSRRSVRRTCQADTGRASSRVLSHARVFVIPFLHVTAKKLWGPNLRTEIIG